MKNGLVKNDSELIGFVRSCYISSINTLELHEWAYTLISQYDDLPIYIYDITEVSQYSELVDSIPFDSYSGCSLKECDAIIGIGYKRGIITEKDDLGISKKAALNALARNPHIEDRFRETFPFIDY